jgi:hypothetical protein
MLADATESQCSLSFPDNERTNIENYTVRNSHAIIGFDPFLAEIDRSSRPVGVAVVDWNKNNIFREDVDLASRSQFHRKLDHSSACLLSPFC